VAFTLMMAVALCIVTLPGAAALDIEDKVFTVGGITYKVLTEGATTGTVQVGDGTMAAVPADVQGALVVPETVYYEEKTYTVTQICNWAFCGSDGLTSITLPDSITFIDYFAFAECPNLTAVYFDGDAPLIGKNTFADVRDSLGIISQEIFAINDLRQLAGASTVASKMQESKSSLEAIIANIKVKQKTTVLQAVTGVSESAIKEIAQVNAASEKLGAVSSAAQGLTVSAKLMEDSQSLQRIAQLEDKKEVLEKLEVNIGGKLAQESQSFIDAINLLNTPKSQQSPLYKAFIDGKEQSSSVAASINLIADNTRDLAQTAKSPALVNSVSQIAAQTAPIALIKSDAERVEKLAVDTNKLFITLGSAPVEISKYDTIADNISVLAEAEKLYVDAITGTLKDLMDETENLVESAQAALNEDGLPKFEELAFEPGLQSNFETAASLLTNSARSMTAGLANAGATPSEQSRIIQAIRALEAQPPTVSASMKQLVNDTNTLVEAAKKPAIKAMVPQIRDRLIMVAELGPARDSISVFASDAVRVVDAAEAARKEIVDVRTEIEAISEFAPAEIEQLENISGVLEKLRGDSDTLVKSAEDMADLPQIGQLDSESGSMAEFKEAADAFTVSAQSMREAINQFERFPGTLAGLAASTPIRELLQAITRGEEKSIAVSSQVTEITGKAKELTQSIKATGNDAVITRIAQKSITVTQLQGARDNLSILAGKAEGIAKSAELAAPGIKQFKDDTEDMSGLLEAAAAIILGLKGTPELLTAAEEAELDAALVLLEQFKNSTIGARTKLEAAQTANKSMAESTANTIKGKLFELSGKAGEVSGFREFAAMEIEKSELFEGKKVQFTGGTRTLLEIIEAAATEKTQSKDLSIVLKSVMSTADNTSPQFNSALAAAQNVIGTKAAAGRISQVSVIATEVSRVKDLAAERISKSDILADHLFPVTSGTQTLAGLIAQATAGSGKSKDFSDRLINVRAPITEARSQLESAKTAVQEISVTVGGTLLINVRDLFDRASEVSGLIEANAIELGQIGSAADAITAAESALGGILPVAPGTQAHVYPPAAGFAAEGDLWHGLEVVHRPYIVKFVDWDDTVLDEQEVYHGFAATAPVDPTRNGWVFIGWDVDFSTISGDLTVTAHYKTAAVTSFNKNLQNSGNNNLTFAVTVTFSYGTSYTVSHADKVNGGQKGNKTFDYGEYTVYVAWNDNNSVTTCEVRDISATGNVGNEGGNNSNNDNNQNVAVPCSFTVTIPTYTGSGSNRVGSTAVTLSITLPDGSTINKTENFTGINKTTTRELNYEAGAYVVGVTVTVTTNGTNNNMVIEEVSAAILSIK
jgi:hypothetical protein